MRLGWPGYWCWDGWGALAAVDGRGKPEGASRSVIGACGTCGKSSTRCRKTAVVVLCTLFCPVGEGGLAGGKGHVAVKSWKSLPLSPKHSSRSAIKVFRMVVAGKEVLKY